MYCSLKDDNFAAREKKKCSRHLIYARACVNKDFVHSGSIGLIQGKHARYVIHDGGIFFSRTLRLTRHSQVNKFIVKAFFAKGKKKKRKSFVIPLMKTELKWDH